MRRLRCDDGTAVIEFTWLALLLLVPLVYVVLAVMRVQAASFAATEASRAAGRAFVRSDSIATGTAWARSAVDVALADQGFTRSSSTLRLSCRLGACLTPGSVVDVVVTIPVALPGVPHALAGATATTVPVVATHTERVDLYRNYP